jgi:D-amino-acid dehydrogenase
MLRMLAASTPTRFARGLAAIGELGRGTLELFHEYRAAGVEFEMHDDGVLMVFRSAEERDHHAHDLAEAARFGSANIVSLSGADVRALEPTLSDHAVAGLLSPDQAHLSPSTFVDGLAARLRLMGVPMLTEQTPVAVRRRGDHVEVLAGRRILTAHRVVIAAGVGSAALAASLGCRIPLRFGKGYGFDLPVPPERPGRAIYLAAERVAVTPLDSGLRLAGTMEFGGDPDAMDLRRATAIIASTRPYFRGDLGPAPQPWSGLRPMLPDGLPAIGEVPGCPAAILATGHAMLGVTLAPRTGRLVRELVLTGRTPVVLSPFAPGRFRRRRP